MKRPYYMAELAALTVLLWPWLPWPVTLLLVAYTCSWGAVGAILAGVAYLHPAVGLYGALGGLFGGILWSLSPVSADGRRSPVLFGRRILEWTSRGDTLDSIRGRLMACRIAATRLTWAGHGHGAMRRDLRRWRSRGVQFLPQEALLCEPLQIAYEYGVMGFIGLVVSLALVGYLLAGLASPSLTASAVSFGVFNLGFAPLRGAWRHARRVFPTPPLLGEITVHVQHDGRFAMHEDVPADRTPEEILAIGAALVRAGTYFAEQRGVEIHFDGVAA